MAVVDEECLTVDCVIEVENAQVVLNDIPVIDGLSLSLSRGEFLMILGQSGSGKTTLLKAIAGLIPYNGSIRLKGNLRMIFQEGLLYPWLTVAGNIALGAGNVPKAEAHHRAEELIAELGIAHLSRKYPHEISGGEKQRVAIARAFASLPDVVLMDEPFGALDVFTREKMQLWLMEFWKARAMTSIIFVSHDIEECLQLGDRAVVMAQGKAQFSTIVPFPRPRDESLKYTEEFIRLRKAVHQKVADSK